MENLKPKLSLNLWKWTEKKEGWGDYAIPQSELRENITNIYFLLAILHFIGEGTEYEGFSEML